MTTSTFFPTSVKTTSLDKGTWDNGAASSDFDAVDDKATDTTYLELTAIDADFDINAVEVMQFTVASVGTIERMRLNWRTRRSDWGEFRLTLGVTNTATGGIHWGPATSWQRPYPLSTIFNYSTPWSDADAAGTTWDEHVTTDGEDVVVIIEHRYQVSTDRLYYIELEVEHEAVPTLVVDGPTGAQSTGAVTTAWTFSHASPQTHYRVKLFDDATYTDGGFDADTSTPDHDSGKISSATAREYVNTADPVEDGDNYRSYVKCWAGDLESAWTTNVTGWSTSYTPPLAPGSITGESFSATTGVLSFSIAAGATGDRLQVQRSTDSGTTWEDAFYTTSLSGTMSDVRVPLNASVRYRARSIDDSSGLVSAWTTDTTDTDTTASSWFLKTETDASAAVTLGIRDYSIATNRPAVVIPNAAGGAPGVVTGGDRGDIIVIEYQTTTKAERDALQALLNLSTPLILQSAQGDSWWVKPLPSGDQKWVRAVRSATETVPHRDLHRGTLRFAEIATPAVSTSG